MTASSPARPGLFRTATTSLGRGPVVLRRWGRARPDLVDLLVLSVLAIACAALVLVWPSRWPLGVMTVPLVIGSMVLNPRALTWFVIGCMGLTVLTLFRTPMTTTALVRVAVVFLLGFVILMVSFRRLRLGVGGARGESMFVDLRDRLLSQHQVPEVPDGWSLDYSLRTAEGTPYSGDFSIGVSDDRRLQLALVDVSGKGQVAGTRALFLSGAMSGLMGALPADRFLPECNDYLVRQDWSEGFATVVHLSLDLETGEYEIRSAGHPPALHLHAGSGRWSASPASGPALGLLDGIDFAPFRGVLARGDALMLFTDGLVETRGRDLDQGLDRLMGHADRVLVSDDERVADRLVRRVGSRNDDCALAILRRD